MDYSVLKENRKIILLNLLSTIIWYSFAYTTKSILATIKDYIMPTYIIHIGFVLVVLVLNIWLGLSLNKRADKKAEVPKHTTIDKFIVEEGPGWLTNPKTNEIFCLSCWYNNKTKIHLVKDGNVRAGWICPICNKTYISIIRMFRYYSGN